MADYWTIITAVSTAATAIAAIVSSYFVYNQWLVSKPSIKHADPGDSSKEFRNLIVNVVEPDDKKWFIKSIKIVAPTEAKISAKISDVSTNKPKPDTWLSQITFESTQSGVGIFYTAPPGSEVEFEVVVALIAKSKVQHTYKIKSRMHQFALL
jgi:hypothetical protein